MGQLHNTHSSTNYVPMFIQFLGQQLISEEGPSTLITEEINDLTYDKLLSALGELNLLSKEFLDEDGKQLVFAVKKGTDSSVFWKATIQIACVKIDPASCKVDSYRLLNLSAFLKVFKTLKCQSSAVDQSKRESEESTSYCIDLESLERNSECCICLERKQEVTLPCTHSYCATCFEEWNDLHDTCPICREKVESKDDAWILSDVPRAEEISNEMKSSLMELTDEKDSSCTTS